jgi:hypothetical protein
MNLKQNNMRTKNSTIGFIMLLAASVFVSCRECPDIDVRYTFTDGTDTTVTIQATPYSSGVDNGRDCYRIAFQKNDLTDVASVEIIPEFGRAKVGDEGYFLNAEGLLTRFLERKEDCMYRTEYNDLGLAGYKNSDEAWVAILKSLDLECREYTKYENGEYTMSLKYDIEHCGVYEPLIVDFYRLADGDANYSGMARKFREYMIANDLMPEPIRERVKDNEILKYAIEAPEIRIRQAWKPAPSPIPHQTLETEPPMHAALTFEQVEDIVDELKRQGVEKAELCLVGWKLRGHDGRDPDIFPVEPALGGEEALRKLIKKGQSEGYMMVGHTNHTDIYSISQEWKDGKYVCKNPDGSLQKKWRFSGGLMYNLCYKPSYEFYMRDEPKVAALGFRGMEFVDVMAMVTPHECYDPEHPLNRRQAAEYAVKMMSGLRDMFGGSQSEGCHYFAAKSVDFAMYSTMKMAHPQKKDIIDAHVPVWQIVFHGYILSNPASETVNYNIKEPYYKLRFIEAGGRPLYYFYSKFMNNGNNWMGEVDLSYKDREDLQNSVKVIKEGFDEYQPMSYLQYETLDNHEEIAPGITCSTFSDGSIIICNYTNKVFRFKDSEVQAEDYLVIKPE